MLFGLCRILCLCWVSTQTASELISRETFFDDPKYSMVTISPDGKQIAFLAPNEFGISNVYVKCITCKETRPATFEMKRHISGYYWTGVPNVIIYSQDSDGDENTKLFKINIENSTPQTAVYTICDRPGVKAMIIDNNLRDHRLLIGINDNNPQFHNLYELNLHTNQMHLIFLNERFPAKFTIDNNLNIRLVMEESDDGSIVYYRPSERADLNKLTSDPDNWIPYMTVKSEDRALTTPIAFTKDNRQMYMLLAKDDLGELVIQDFDRPDHSELLYKPSRTQIFGVIFHPVDRTVLSVTEYYHKPEHYVANATILDDMQYLANLRPHASPIIESTSNDFNLWLVTYTSDSHPFEYFLYDRRTKHAKYLFTTRPELINKPINKMVGFDFNARDGLKIQAYLSLPPQAKLLSADQVHGENVELAKIGLLPVNPQKLIVFVHGGPKARDFFGFSSFNAWLTNRNYAVLQVNFRGSVGFGKKLINAGNGEWARKMHTDLLDAVDFVVKKGIARRDSIAIMGASYGGFATLVGLTFTPDVFSCGVDIVGPSNLITLLETIPPYWVGFYNDMITMLGADKNTEEGIASLKSRSPLFFANKVRKPLLMIHGSNDPRVRQSESEQFVAELKKNNIPVNFVVYGNEGHGPRRPENVLSMAGIIENFLQKCLHGDAQPYRLGQYNSSAIIDGPIDFISTYPAH
ncbi:Dipeptidyl peptidase family member 6 [Aphelenchoides besseyi]|nr:Dipeptidyl peptidase family member 6 [Aphelenchoides besseyi]KAI6201105.1 Dipeptidyl peptidase family member 6 [Aphelenchoides besseyi]